MWKINKSLHVRLDVAPVEINEGKGKGLNVSDLVKKNK